MFGRDEWNKSLNKWNAFVDEKKSNDLRDYPFSTYAKFTEKLTFLTPWCAHERVCAYQGITDVSFRKILRKY